MPSAQPPDDLALWKAKAAARVRALSTSVNRVESALRAGDLVRALEVANFLVDETADSKHQAIWDGCPDAEAEAEFRAALGVLRNAAYAIRQLMASEGADATLGASSAALLGQGRLHLEHFSSITGIEAG
jgi:hypothetical protein